MSTSLWPALLAAVLGGGGRAALEDEQQLGGSMHPVQHLLALSLLGEHALYWWMGILCFVGLAYATNPSEASFKTHLTDLSFHLHLRRLRAHDPDSLHLSNPAQTLPGDFKRPASPSAASSSTSQPASIVASSSKDQAAAASSAGGKNSSSSGNVSGSGKVNKNNNTSNSTNNQSATNHGTAARINGQTPIKPGRHAHANGETGRPHVLSFSNRVSISLKTPAYVRTSYALWSTVRILPASSAPKGSSSGTHAGSSKSSGNTTGTPGRPILNGVPAVTRRASTTLPSIHDRSSKKSNANSTSSASISASSSSKSRKGGLVSTVAHGISAGLAAPVCSPWLEQGGYFIGFLGYWWTVDDGTSFSGAREKTRLGNALLAVEEQDEDDDVSVDQHGPDSARHADDLEGGHAFLDIGNAQTHASRVDEHAVHVNAGNTNVKRKHPSKASQGASFRGGQRRSSPTPRQVSSKKRGSGSGSATGPNASQTASSGDVTPVTPNSAIPLDRTRLHPSHERDNLATTDDSQLPGLPFHVDRRTNDLSSQQQQQDPHYLKEGGEEVVTVDGQVKPFIVKEGEEGLSTVSHTASGPDAAVAAVSPALALLQSQLDDLRTTSVATQTKLEAEIEELQSRRRDEDAVRTELKARTKMLEESKREAESERLDAEKKLISARSLKKGVEDRVSKARSELTKLEKKEKEIQEKMFKAREERRVKLDELRDKVKHREALLIKEEEATEKLNKRVALLEKEIEDRKNDLFNFRREEANAAALAVTNRMNRAGRGTAGAPAAPSTTVVNANMGGPSGNHTHAHGPHSGASITAKRHMYPVHVGHAHAAHRHPSQHPNAAVPIAYPYISPEDQAKQANNARSSSPSGAAAHAASTATKAPDSGYGVVPAAGNADGQTFGSTFMDHRMQSRRAASAAGTLGTQAGATQQPAVSSSMNTSVIGNSASAASALYSRQLDGNDDDRLVDIVDVGDNDELAGGSRNMIPGSTFAPFGPASPTSPSTIGANSPREQHSLLNGSPSLVHMPYFASDKAQQQHQQSRMRMSTSREDIFAAMRAQAGEEGKEYINAADLDSTPVMGLARELAVVDDNDEVDSYAVAKPRGIGGKAGNGGLRRESFDSVGSFTSSNGGPLSPMTPHQASLIPSQLFDMLDDVEMPASPTPFQMASGLEDPHHTFTQGISDAFDQASSEITNESTTDGLQAHGRRRTSGMYSPWADFDIDAGFDFDKPLGGGNAIGSGGTGGFHASSAGVSRKPSGREALVHQHVELLRRSSGSPLHASPLENAPSATGTTTMQGDAIFASYGPTHGHHGSVGSIGQRSNTSSSGGSISPSLASSAAQQNASAAMNNNNSSSNSNLNIVNLPAGFGKLSPNDLLFDKARHALSLNPDAKAFNFNRPLPSSASAGSLNSIGGGAGGRTASGGNLPSNAVGAIGDARHAFDSAVSGGGGGDSPILSNGSAINPGNGTWASPNLSSRGLHNLGYGNSASSSSASGGNANLRESVRSASGPSLTNPSGGNGPSTGLSFSPFDDDDLLKGW